MLEWTSTTAVTHTAVVSIFPWPWCRAEVSQNRDSSWCARLSDSFLDWDDVVDLGRYATERNAKEAIVEVVEALTHDETLVLGQDDFGASIGVGKETTFYHS